MDIFFFGCLTYCEISIFSTVTKFSTYDNLFYSDDTAFSRTGVLAPLVVKLVESSATFSKLNLMISIVTSLKWVEEESVTRPPRKA